MGLCVNVGVGVCVCGGGYTCVKQMLAFLRFIIVRRMNLK